MPNAAVPLREQVVRDFAARFGAPPAFVTRAPGRVNLIGDHTDYNDGFVLPMAIDRAVWIALRPRPDTRVVVHSLEYDEIADLDVTKDATHGRGWTEYVRGVAWSLRGAGHELCGWEGVVAGDVPQGAGLSSSAALELSVSRAFAAACGLAWDPTTMATLAQRAENEWVGVNCGIMDQLISAAGIANHAMLIDCRTLETRPVRVPDDCVVVVLDTATRRGLVDSAYNERRRQCETAAAVFGVDALRDVDVDTLERRAAELDEETCKRARHVVTENARVVAAADALERRDAAEVGRLMNESHVSLRDDFEVSRRELDVMVELAQGRADCHGARMTGAGFGGCAVALVDASAWSDFASHVVREYQEAVGLVPAVYVCSASAGASAEEL